MLGARPADVYVHVPGAATRATAASFPQRNYRRPAFPWRRLVDVQGFHGLHGGASRGKTGSAPTRRGVAPAGISPGEPGNDLDYTLHNPVILTGVAIP
jgi:hypothetical protein